MNEIAIDTLNARLKALDEEHTKYVENRKSLVDAIQKLGGNPRLKRVEVRIALPAKNGAVAASHPNVRSVSDALKIAISQMQGQFELKDIRNYFVHHFPDILSTVSQRTVGVRLWEAYDKGHLSLVAPGKGGKSNVYVRKNGEAT